jgi:type II secretory ATPase GspE/PulE/Tfp pilus assembly ATPase PilB-like protein
MPEPVVAALRGSIHKSQGMLVVCGPTGSGKTTSVYAALTEIDKLTRNIVTIEDPIEYQLQDVSQIAVDNKAGVTFAKILRSVLRQDPDVLLVGEIRDRETAEIAMQAALTGHLVLTTIHANDTASTVTRLIDMGVEATLIQSTVTGILAQRLVRVLCPVCKKAYRPKRAMGAIPRDGNRQDGSAVDGQVLFKPVGCNACLRTGYRGRTGVFEFMPIDGEIRGLLTGKPSVEVIRSVAKRNGMITMKRSAKEKVMMGVTSAEEAQRVVG